ncbi:hypothetical protein [Rhodoplanes roseus]|uniref:hypothetical protein n=1 Tax=Rhodoplanes roseus TaxID=29409 RepID=UPI0011B7FCBD|nr:hypothetical protein [Rhodoplanes roseus]
MSARRSTKPSAKPANRSNPGGEARFAKKRSAIRATAAIARTAKQIWPRGTAADLASAAGLESDRAAQLLLAADGTASAETILRLMFHPVYGRAFHAAIMSSADPMPPWWRDLTKQQELSDARAQLRALNKRIGRLEDGEDA